MFERIKKWYHMGLWTKEMVENAVKKGLISCEQAEELTGEACT